jgi:hypothetical protein
MLAHALGHEAVRRGYTVLCLTADKMFARLKGSRLDATHDAELRRLTTVGLLIVDDLALKALDLLETNDLYEIVTSRHRMGSMVVTSNRSPAEWLPMLADPLHAQALVDSVHEQRLRPGGRGRVLPQEAEAPPFRRRVRDRGPRRVVPGLGSALRSAPCESQPLHHPAGPMPWRRAPRTARDPCGGGP